MSPVAAWCVRHRRTVLVGWIALLVGLAAVVIGAGASFGSDVVLPDSESSTAYELLDQAQPGATDVQPGKIAWHTDGVAVDDPAMQAQATAMLDAFASEPGVVAVVGPYGDASAGQIDASSDTAYATVSLTSEDNLERLREIAGELSGPAVEVALGGQAFTELPSPSPATEGIGIALALVVLLIAFRSRWAAALPVVTGLVGVGASLLTVLAATNVLDLPEESITMASMIGLGVGIDYALFIVNRYRKALMAGASVGDAVAQALNTSGRAVVFAGLTVVVALVGMVVVQLSVLTAMAVSAAVAVVFTVATALTLLPALLGMLGHRVLSRAQRPMRGAAYRVPWRHRTRTTRQRCSGAVPLVGHRRPRANAGSSARAINRAT